MQAVTAITPGDQQSDGRATSSPIPSAAEGWWLPSPAVPLRRARQNRLRQSLPYTTETAG